MAPPLQDVGLAVKRLQWRHHRAANERLAELGVSLVQWDVLRHLGRQPDASLHALAELTFQTDQSMGTLATRMIQRGLIERVPGPGRAVHHRLTARGEEMRSAGARVLDGVLAESLGQLRDDDLAELHRLLLLAYGPEQAAPTADQSAPTADQSAPTADQSAPTADQSAPTADQSAPTADQSAPTADQAAPTADQAAPTADQAAPTADQSRRDVGYAVQA